MRAWGVAKKIGREIGSEREREKTEGGEGRNSKGEAHTERARGDRWSRG